MLKPIFMTLCQQWNNEICLPFSTLCILLKPYISCTFQQLLNQKAAKLGTNFECSCNYHITKKTELLSTAKWLNRIQKVSLHELMSALTEQGILIMATHECWWPSCVLSSCQYSCLIDPLTLILYIHFSHKSSKG